MAINKQITLNWKGVEYRPKITMEVIDRLEDRMNLLQMVQQVNAGDVRFSRVAILFAHLLNAAGADVTPDEIFQGMFGGDAVDEKDLGRVLGEVFSVIFPEPKKKPQPSRKGAKGKK